MNKIILYSFSLFIFAGCASKKQLLSDNNGVPTLRIKAYNISEDLSRLASQNDEILILAYKNQEELNDPLIMEYLVFDEKQSIFNIPITPGLFQDTGLILFLLEVDTELSPKEIEMQVRENALTIEDEYSEKNRVALKAILGDDDILGVARINKETLSFTHIYNFFGTYKLDRFEYELHFMHLNNIE